MEEELKQMEADAELWRASGGTMSSARLQEALYFYDRLEVEPVNERTEHLRARAQVVISKWRSALRIHNAQVDKIIEYTYL